MAIFKFHFLLKASLIGVTSISCLVANAQDFTGAKLVNFETGRLQPAGKSVTFLDERLFGGKESNSYTSFATYWGLAPGIDLSLKAGAGARKTYVGTGFNIRYGGTDLESQVRFAIPSIKGLSISAGVAYPSTPSRDSSLLTAGVQYKTSTKDIPLVFGFSTSSNRDETLAALWIGTEVAANPYCSLVFDFGWLVSGENSYNTSDGTAKRIPVYGFGFRWRGARELGGPSYFFGITNSLGATTGFSSSSALGGTTGLCFGISFGGR